MSKTFVVTLDGVDYTLHQFSLGEFEEVLDLRSELSPAKASFAIFKIALRRATPAIPDPDALEITQPEFIAAMDKIMKASGMEASKKGEAPAPTGTAQG